MPRMQMDTVITSYTVDYTINTTSKQPFLTIKQGSDKVPIPVEKMLFLPENRRFF